MSLLQVRDLIKKYGSKTAVKGLTLDVHEGRCVALLGPNGAGKTTTLNMIAGLTTPSSGSVKFEGMAANDDIRKFIGYLPQYPSFYGWMTGQEFLIYVGKLAGVEKNLLMERSDELLKLVGIFDAKKRRISGYSGGMKQRLGLAQAMIHSPKLLILDEPVSALDPIGRREVLEMMQKLKQETTILFSTHILNDAEEICDDIVIISNGEIVIHNTLPNIRNEALEPIISIELEEITQDITSLLSSLDFVKDIQINGNKIKLTVENIAVSKDILLKLIVEKEIPIHRFEVGQMTLEELFMKVVKQ